MTLLAIVPMRGLRSGKQRLAGALSAPAREALNRELLEGVLSAVTDALGGWSRCLVQSADPSLVDEVIRRGGIGQLDPPGAGLNDALDHARQEARRRDARLLLVLSADLPAVTAEAIAALLAAGNEAPVVLVADKTDSGTNGLLLPAALDFQFAFGADSLSRHQRECARLGQPARIWRAPALQFDLDTEADLQQWRAQPFTTPRRI